MAQDDKLQTVIPEPEAIKPGNVDDELEKVNNKPVNDDTKDDADDDDKPPPVLPKRPTSDDSNTKKLSQTEITISQLVDIFPTVDLKYIKMALIASEGRLEPASNALLFLSDPNSGIEIPQHPVSILEQNSSNVQYKDDEALAKRLAKSYEKKSKKSPYAPNDKIKRTPSMSSNHKVYNDFGDDDDGEDLYDTFNKNLNEAKQIVGGWFGNVSKKLQESLDDSDKTNNYHNNRNPYKPQYVQNRDEQLDKRYYRQNDKAYDDDLIIDDDDDDVPRLPPRKSATNQLYSAVSNSKIPDSKAETTIKMNVNDDDDDDELYTVSSSKITMNKASKEKDQIEKEKEVKKDEIAEPASDVFAVDDSEDDTESDSKTNDKAKKDENDKEEKK